MKIKFVVPTYNRVDAISKSLPFNKEICEKHGCGLMVLDNDSSDGTSDKIKKDFPGVELVKNDRNIGLKGSFYRIVSDLSRKDELAVILSDEDVIYEVGLIRLIDCLKGRVVRGNEILVFNYINTEGKDFFHRRAFKKIESWGDVEVFSFGLISGFGYIINDVGAVEGVKDKVYDPRNNYPHWSLMFDSNTRASVVGFPIACGYFDTKRSDLSSEWKSKKNHFAKESALDYLTFHKNNYKEKGASFFRAEYFSIARIYECVNGKKKSALWWVFKLFCLNQKLAIQYVARYFN